MQHQHSLEDQIRKLEEKLRQNEKELFQAKNILGLLEETSKVITSEVELERLVQRITDKATELSGAKFGAFFYNVDAGSEYLLYVISGVPKEKFSKFPLPRATDIFRPTFEGNKVVRYEDVTKSAEYGHNAPYFGMPKGHLPVKSYLAVPVISPVTGKVLGGIFLGHPEPGVFTENEEKLVQGIALQGALAMGNSHLFEEKSKAEVELKTQKDLYKKIFNSTFNGVLILDHQARILQINDVGSGILGIPGNDLIGKDLKTILESFDPSVLNVDALKDDGFIKFHSKISRSDGHAVDLDCRARLFENGEQPHIMLMVKDITEHLKTEEALKRSMKFSDIISETSPVVLWLTNEAGELNYINSLWFEWVGGTFEDHKGEGWFEYIYANDRDVFIEKFKSTFSSRGKMDMDFRVLNKEGRLMWLNIKAEPNSASDSFFAGLAGSIMDITHRKKAEKELESQNTLIRTIAENATLAVFLVNSHGVCTYMNPAAEHMTGYRLSDARQDIIMDLLQPEGNPILTKAQFLFLSTKVQGEAIFTHKKGTTYPVFFTASPLPDKDQNTKVILEVRDTTEEKVIQRTLREQDERVKQKLETLVKERTAELEKINYELLQFTSIASHDLKEPVRKISIFANLLKDKLKEALEKDTLRYIDNIIQSSVRMIGLINDLLTFSRLSHFENFSEVNLNEIIAGVLNDLEIPINEKKAKIEADEFPLVEGVALQYGQIFQNLISNSLKFSDPERPLKIRIKFEPINEDRFRIVYTDTGIGFDPKFSEKIFKVFQRLHTKDKYEGTGIGLSIVKKIVIMHKGEVTATGEEGKGARFEIILPYKQ